MSRRTAAACSTARRDCGASTPATAVRRSSKRSAPSRRARLPPARSRWGTRRRSSAPRASSTIAPPGFDHVFFTNSGSESVDTALKIAIAYHRAQGQRIEDAPHRPRARLSRRQLRRHLGRRHRRQPQAVRRAGAAASITCATRTTSHATLSAAASRSTAPNSPTIWSGSWRCTTPRPSPRSSSSRWPARPACWCRRRAICSGSRRSATKHDILLIFDEVITASAASARRSRPTISASMPDLITIAKGITNGAVPMGAVFVQSKDARGVHDRPRGGDRVLPRLHVLGAPAGVRGVHRDARHAAGGGAADACGGARALLATKPCIRSKGCRTSSTSATSD